MVLNMKKNLINFIQIAVFCFFFAHVTQLIWKGNYEVESARLAKILLVALLFCIIVYYFFFSREQVIKIQAELYEAKLKQEKIQNMATQSQLKLLQSQIEPHFLFNTLANLKALIQADPVLAEQLLDKFTGLLRSSLSKSRAHEINLDDELNSLKIYLEIQQIRLGNRLSFSIKKDDNLPPEIKLPPLLLQPLVENAVFHGIEPKIEGGTISIVVSQNNDKLQIQIIDDGIGLQENNPNKQGHGFALSNIRQRLGALFGPQASLTIKSNNNNSGVIAIVECPCEH